jgi:hypothetical protein
MSSRHVSLSYVVFMPDEEFDVLGEEDLALLSRQFEHMYKNQKNARRSSGMCCRCGKHGHFIIECPEAMEVTSTSTIQGSTTGTTRGTTTGARTSPSGGQGGVVVTRSVRWLPV